MSVCIDFYHNNVCILACNQNSANTLDLFTLAFRDHLEVNHLVNHYMLSHREELNYSKQELRFSAA